jgi:hypothetical protein
MGAGLRAEGFLALLAMKRVLRVFGISPVPVEPGEFGP